MNKPELSKALKYIIDHQIRDIHQAINLGHKKIALNELQDLERKLKIIVTVILKDLTK